MKNRDMALQIAQKVHAAGGRVYYVGGYVRDTIMGKPGKDIDIEVHGITPEVLCAILDELGERTTMGMSFGVFGLKHYDIDIAMPRKEKAFGRGHRDFIIDIDPFIGEKAAASRRDFTMNALMQDVLTGEILDFFGGCRDIEKKVIRHVSDVSFIEDALRVLRAAQFSARFAFEVAPETRALCSVMELEAIAPERIMAEMEKALLKAALPSAFFEELRKMGQLSTWFSRLEALIGVEQNPQYHPEGDVWTHTMQVLDRGAGLRESSFYPLGFMVAALCHDFGKPSTTTVVKGQIHSIGHEEAGVPVAQAFLRRLTLEEKLIRYTLNMVKMHMKPNIFASSNAADKKYMKMFDESVNPEDLLLLAQADRGYDGDDPRAVLLAEKLSRFRELQKTPPVMGADLVAKGISPGPLVGEMLSYARKLWYAGIPHQEALQATLSQFRDR